jgi:hypothetical protein
MLVLRRQPLGQRPATIVSARVNRAAIRAARKKKLDEVISSEPFSKWRARKLEKMKDPAAFPTQVVWYVVAVALLVSFYVSHINLTFGLA